MTSSVTEDAKKKADVRKLAVEGDPIDGWVLVDFGNLVVHLFSQEQRNYYKLEELWSMGHTVLRIQ